MTNNKMNFLIDYSKFLDSSGHHLTYSAISTYRNFGAELSEKEKAFLKNHITSCDACSALLKEVEEVEGSQSQSKFALWTIPTVYRYSIAATIVIALGISAALYLTNRHHPSTETLPPGQSLAVQGMDPERFTPNAMLENFVGRSLRSGSDVQFITPGVGDTLSTPFTFRWDSQKGGRSYTLRVMDNKNGQVWMGSTGSGSIDFKAQVEPGLYYAKLEADGALVRVGRFVVIRK
jgi:hypothetical protein